MKKSKIKIDCAHDELVPLEKLLPHPKNPKHHPPEQIALYARIISENGFRRALVVSRRSGFIVKGNGAYQAAQALGMAAVPVDFQEYASAAHELADLSADNALAELGETDDTKLSALLKEITDAGMDAELAGIISSIETDLPEPTIPQEIPENFSILIECKSESQQTKLLTRFEKEGLTCKALIS